LRALRSASVHVGIVDCGLRTRRIRIVHAVASRASREPVAAKVPEVTFIFWVIKLLTTAGGEATSDYLALHGYVLAGVVEVVIFLVAVWLQLRTRRYVAIPYWFLALAIAIFGTGVSDALHLIVGIPYAGTTTGWAVVLAATFWLWHRSERTLSFHSIVTRRRELYYWTTVFATFALGTALGDFTAAVLHLGYLASGVMFGVIILIPAVAWWRFRLNSVVAFWFAYVVTRPVGASFADYVSKPAYITGSGLNYGDGPTAAVALAAIVILVAYVAIARRDIQQPIGTGASAGAASTASAGAPMLRTAPDFQPERTPAPNDPDDRRSPYGQ
jgi:uncharacterized membrane-anchored protein